MSAQQPIVIFKGDDSSAFSLRVIKIKLTTDISLVGATAKFSLLSYKKTFTNAEVMTKQFEIALSSDITKNFPLGIVYGDLRLLDQSGKILTASCHIPFEVRLAGKDNTGRWTSGPCAPSQVEVTLGVDYSLVFDKPTINGVPVNGDMSGKDYGLNRISAYSAAETYAVNDQVLNGTGIYECTTAITTPEAWNPAHWRAIGGSGDMSHSEFSGVETLSNATLNQVAAKVNQLIGILKSSATVAVAMLPTCTFGDLGPNTQFGDVPPSSTLRQVVEAGGGGGGGSIPSNALVLTNSAIKTVGGTSALPKQIDAVSASEFARPWSNRLVYYKYDTVSHEGKLWVASTTIDETEFNESGHWIDLVSTRNQDKSWLKWRDEWIKNTFAQTGEDANFDEVTVGKVSGNVAVGNNKTLDVQSGATFTIGGTPFNTVVGNAIDTKVTSATNAVVSQVHRITATNGVSAIDGDLSIFDMKGCDYTGQNGNLHLNQKWDDAGNPYWQGFYRYGSYIDDYKIWNIEGRKWHVKSQSQNIDRDEMNVGVLWSSLLDFRNPLGSLTKAVTSEIARHGSVVSSALKINGIPLTNDITIAAGVTPQTVTNIVTNIVTKSYVEGLGISGSGASFTWMRPNDWAVGYSMSNTSSTIVRSHQTTDDSYRIISNELRRVISSLDGKAYLEVLDPYSENTLPISSYFPISEGVTIDSTNGTFTIANDGMYKIGARRGSEVRYADIAAQLFTSGSTNLISYYFEDVAGSGRKSVNDAAKVVLDAATFVSSNYYDETDIGYTNRHNYALYNTFEPHMAGVSAGNVSPFAVSRHILASAKHYQPWIRWTGNQTFNDGQGHSATVTKLRWVDLADWALENGFSKEVVVAADVDDISMILCSTNTAVPDACIPKFMTEEKAKELFGDSLSGVCAWAFPQCHKYAIPIVMGSFDGMMLYSPATYSKKNYTEGLEGYTRADICHRLKEMGEQYYVHSGDSGRPIFIMVNGSPVIVSAWTSCNNGTGLGPSYIKGYWIIKAFVESYGDTLKTL